MCNRYRFNPRLERRVRRDIEDWDSVTEAPREIFPDGIAPVVVRAGEAGLRAVSMRWGFPSPQAGGKPVTNARNLQSPFWRPWLKVGQRCIAPANSFCEWSGGSPKIAHWFGIDAGESLFGFAGLWRPWTGLRKGIEGEHLLFTILTTDANAVVRPIHEKAMPVILREDEWDAWLDAPVDDALAMQKPLPDDPVRGLMVLRADPPRPKAVRRDTPDLL